MKTAKALSTITLVATIILVPMSSAWAHHGHHHGHHGAVWGAAVGGTMLGLVMSGVANQPRQSSQPQVVVVQPPPRPGVDDAAYVRAAEMMRLKQQNDRLKWELDLLKAQQAQGDAIVNNVGE